MHFMDVKLNSARAVSSGNAFRRNERQVADPWAGPAHKQSATEGVHGFERPTGSVPGSSKESGGFSKS
jgi:hypothetical protein